MIACGLTFGTSCHTTDHGPKLHASKGSWHLLAMARVQELRELVLLREEELRYAQWKLEDAKTRLKNAEGEEWARELDDAQAAVQAQSAVEGKAAGPAPPWKKREAAAQGEPVPQKPAPPGEPAPQKHAPPITPMVVIQIPDHTEPPQAAPHQAADAQAAHHPAAYPTAAPHLAAHAELHQDAPAPSGANKAHTNKISAESLMNVAKQAASRVAESKDCQNQFPPVPPAVPPAGKTFEEMGLPIPPAPPPAENVATLCPIRCDCGEACTRIERMLQEQQRCPEYARKRLKHNNHKRSACQLQWLQNKRRSKR